MSAKHNEPDATQRIVTSPQRPNLHLRRSMTEQSAPFRQSIVHQYLHRKGRDRDDRVPVSAGPRLRSSLEFTPAEADMEGDNMSNAGERAAPQLRVLINQDVEDLQYDERLAAAKIANLQKALAELNAMSTARIDVLDETFASVAQRHGSLRSTIAAVKEIAILSQNVNEKISSDTRVFASEIESVLSVYDQSDEEQRKRIQDLVVRIHTTRDKVQALSQRIAVVRDRLEGWATADREWQELTRRRLRVLSIISILAFLMILVFLGITKYTSSPPNAEIPIDGQGQILPSIESVIGNHSQSAEIMAEDVREELARRRPHHSAIEQEALREFDEL